MTEAEVRSTEAEVMPRPRTPSSVWPGLARPRPGLSLASALYLVDRELILKGRLVYDSSLLIGPTGQIKGLPLVNVLDLI